MSQSPYDPPKPEEPQRSDRRRSKQNILLLACVVALLGIGIAHKLAVVTAVGIIFGLIWLVFPW